MSAAWIDVSVPLREGMVHWPGDPPARIRKTKDLDRGDSCTVSQLDLGSHTGTHMDAPGHFLRGGAGIDAMPLDATVGPARVIAIRDPASITARELRRHGIRRGERILFKTANSAARWARTAFAEDFVAIAQDAARLLAQRRVRCVGVDYLSVGGYRDDGAAIHRTLLGAGIWLIEGLNLSRVAAGAYELICLPLRIAGGDGAPARAVLRRRR
jgi:arylformamidase